MEGGGEGRGGEGRGREVRGSTAIYGLHRYEPLSKFSAGLLWNRVYKSENLGLLRISFSRKLVNWLKILVQTRETGICHLKIYK